MKDTIDKAKALAPKPVPIEKVNNSALLFAACCEILLGVCDDIKETTVYQHEVKLLTNKLSKLLASRVATLYANLKADEDEEFLNVVRAVENTAGLLTTLTPAEIDQVAVLIADFKAGEVYRPTTPKQMENLLNQKRVKPIK